MPQVNVLMALTGFRKATGASDKDAAAWATAHLAEGQKLAQDALDANVDPRAGQGAALAALKAFAQS